MKNQPTKNEMIKVLIADDSEYLRKSISTILSNDQSIKIVDYAKNGKEAVNLVKQHHPDVLILDLIMPEMNGLDAFKQIMDLNPTPTIILSAINPQNMDTSIQALLMGAFDYVIKPGGLGAKNLPKFKEELLTKVLLASQSQIKRIFEKEHDLYKRPYIRQEIVSETFKFGQYINKLEPIQEIEDTKVIISIDTNSPKEPLAAELEPVKEDIVLKKEAMKSNIEQINVKVEPIKQTEIIIKSHTKDIKEHVKSINYDSRSEIRLKPKKGKIFDRVDLSPVKGVRISTNLVVIGASVGGPRTLKTVLMNIPADVSCPILVVQHLSEPFVNSFISNLNDVCKIKIKVGVDGEYIQPGMVYFAPGGEHMNISVKNNQPCLKIYKGEPVHFCIPSIDILFFSASKIYRNRTLGILLTGMGEDGVDGLETIKIVGGKTIAESEETAVLYGMPKFAVQRNIADYVLPNYKIKDYIIEFSKNRKLK
ncbi:MAG: chemotaxis-specific protein-glutamate methyltransferase CheB [Promethearchaeota archaeon]|nr:MAG: chemotaxis-specific protein-glutamate methyltransferase CheB [Candidatus Lokiarchaeota archaeon]